MPADHSPRPGGAYPTPSAGTVLVVEPAPDELERIARQLSEHGWRVVPVEDGHTALDWAEVFRPQAVVLSATLPDADGREVLMWLRQIEAVQSAVVVLVVHPDEPLTPDDRARATAVLPRPVNLARLVALLAQRGHTPAPAR